MGRILLSLLDMLRLRSGPQDLPAGGAATLVLVALYVSGGFLAGSVLKEPDYAPQSLLTIGVQFAVIAVLLRTRGFATRVLQTIGALAGTGFLLGLASIYLLSLIDTSAPQAGLVGLYFGLFIWSLAVDGHIYRHALSSNMGTGVLVAVGIFAVNFMLIRTLFG